jgi:hypothetical protein
MVRDIELRDGGRREQCVQAASEALPGARAPDVEALDRGRQ